MIDWTAGKRELADKLRRVDAWTRRWIVLPVPWFFVIPGLLALVTWFGVRTLAFTDGTWVRIPALPKVFFDQTMYLQVMAKDIIHGFHILPTLTRPLIGFASLLWPAVTLSEFYVAGIILSIVSGMLLFAALIRRVEPGLSIADARMRTLAAFLIAHAILVLRPGAPSWYVPFFLGALWLVWIGEGMHARRPVRAWIAWVVALILSVPYPWYFASIAAMIGLLFLLRWIRPARVLPLLAVGLVGAWIAVVFREPLMFAIRSSYTVLVAYHGGVQFSHVTTISNTILLLVAWCIWWFPQALRSVRRGEGRGAASFLFVAWIGQALLWFHSLLTGLSIIPDHFIYTVWIFSAISWAVGDGDPSAPRTRTRWVIGSVAGVYLLSVIVRILFGIYDWTVYPSLVIHLASWMFLLLAVLPLPQARITRIAFVIGCVSTLFGIAGVAVSATTRAQLDGEVDGVRQWMMREPAPMETRICSDAFTSDFLMSTTGYRAHPAISAMRDPATIEQLQARIIEFSAFYNARIGGDQYIVDDMILHDLDFPCRVFGPGIRIVDALPLSRETKEFVTGCNQQWADAERARVITAMEDRWKSPTPSRTVLCDRFVVRKRLKNAWQIPSFYTLRYEDTYAAVYGVQ